MILDLAIGFIAGVPVGVIIMALFYEAALSWHHPTSDQEASPK